MPLASHMRTPHLESVLERYSAAAKRDGRIERYRVPPNPDFEVHMDDYFRKLKPSLRPLDGWFLSDDLVSLVVEGGWWPTMAHRHWPAEHRLRVSYPPLLQETALMGVWLDDGFDLTVRWFDLTPNWQHVRIYTPALREPQPSAPLWIEDYESGTNIVAFPSEAAFIEAHLLAYETIGYDEDRDEIPLTAGLENQVAPRQDRRCTQDELLVQDAIDSAAASWGTSHPLWLSDLMPFRAQKRLDWPVLAHLLGAPLSALPEYYRSVIERPGQRLFRLPGS